MTEENKGAAVALPETNVLPMTWYDGPPPFPQDQEWFIAETTFGDRVVLRSLDEGRAQVGSYKFHTADGTYMKAELVKRWMQFPDCMYLPPRAEGEADLRARLAAAEAERDELEDRLAEEESGPWPEWAEQCLAIVRRYNDNDGASDQTDGVDLPGELEAWLSEIDAISRKQKKQLAALREELNKAIQQSLPRQKERTELRMAFEEVRARLAAAEAEVVRLQRAAKIAELKASGTLANNLCPDHRDKQVGQPCLACSIERLRAQRDEAVAALEPFVRGQFTYFSGKVIGCDSQITREDVERARATLASLKEQAA